MINNNDIHTGEQLKQRFPYQFAHPDATFEFYRGWMPIVAGLCIELDKLLGEQRALFQWKQMKEKFGSARLYYALAGESVLIGDIHLPEGPQTLQIQPDEPSDLFQRVDTLVRAAQEVTKHACMVCGAKAETRSYGGYLQTLCGAHRPDVIGRKAVREMAKPTLPRIPPTGISGLQSKPVGGPS